MNPPARQQPAPAATERDFPCCDAPREGSDAQEAREAAYARACGIHSWHATTERFRQTARAVMAVADAERNTAYARGYQAAREHWKARAESAEAEVERLTQVVARRKAHAEQAESERDAALVALASQDTYTEEGGLIVVAQLREQRARAESAERARDAALAEVAELRDRLGRVEALHQPTPTVHGPDYCQTCSASASEWVKWPCAVAKTLAAPVTGDTEDASPAASPTEQATEGGAK